MFEEPYELCPCCEYEVQLRNIKFIKQSCPICNSLVKACSLCTDADRFNCYICTSAYNNS